MNHKNLFILIFLAIIIFLARLHTIDEPLERDFGTYSLLGHGLLQGRELYVDLWDIKPPAIYLSFAAAQWLVGYNQFAIFLLGLFAAVVTLLGIYVVGERLHKGSGIFAALFWTLICSDLYTQANQPNTEVFINACFVWAFAIWINQPSKMTQFILIGLLCAIATFYKQITIIFPLFIGLTYILLHKQRIVALWHTTIAAVVGFAVWLSVMGYFAWKGHFTAFYQTNFEFVSGYAGNVFNNILSGFILENLFPDFFTLLIPLLILPVIGLGIGLWKQDKAAWFLLSYALAIPIMIALPSQYFPHYYQYWLPWLAIANAWAIFVIATHVKKTLVDIRLTFLMGSGIATIILAIQLPLYFLSADEWSYKKYGPLFIFSKQMGQEINQLLKPDEQFYQWGNETQLYLYAQRQAITGIPFRFAFGFGPSTQAFLHKSLEQLKANPPDLVILSLAYPLDKNVLTQWIIENYIPHPHNKQRMAYYRSKALSYVESKQTFNFLHQEQLIYPVSPPLPPLGFFLRKDSDLAMRVNDAIKPLDSLE